MAEDSSDSGSESPKDVVPPGTILTVSLSDDLIIDDDINFEDNLDEGSPYFDREMFSLLFDTVPGFSFDSSDSILGDGTMLLDNEGSNSNGGSSEEDGRGSQGQVLTANPNDFQEVELEEANSFNVCDTKNCRKIEVSESGKTYTAETVMNSEISNGGDNQIPKIKIKIKSEPKSDTEELSAGINVPTIKAAIEPEFPSLEFSTPMTIADNVKLGRRRNTKSDDSEHNTSKKVTDTIHKKKTRHKKHKHSSKKSKRKHSDINQNFELYTQNGFAPENSPKALVKKEVPEYYDSEEERNNVNNYFPVNTSWSQEKSSTSADIDFNTYNNEQVEVSKDSYLGNKETESSIVEMAADSFEFSFPGDSVLSIASLSNNPKELNGSIDGFFEDIDMSLGDGNIPDLSKSLIVDIDSMKDLGSSKDSSFSSLTDKEQCNPTNKETAAGVKPSNKSSVVTELIDELHAHNQQVFEEIEISTPELELELSDAKNSIHVVQPEETSHIPQICANSTASKQNGNGVHNEHTNSQNFLPNNKTLSDLSNKTSASESSTNAHNGIVQPRKISSSGSSFTSKSSTSHRTYRKKRSRISSSSSSSSETEEFYNRPVKYDPATDTYCDEFGRVVRQSELKFYLNSSKSSHRDSYSNNGSSSSTVSRSKSPHRSSHHKKHHSSRSHKRRRYSSSRSRSKSRSRSHERKYKHNYDRKYRSPSSRSHARKPHYMDLEENVKANEERRVMYVGDIPPGYTIDDLKERFSLFGPIQDATIKSKTTLDSSLYIFGFITFKNRMDACNAIENGNNNPLWPKFDLNFGGRRRFCNGNYTDLDGKTAEAESNWYGYQYQPHQRYQPVKKEDDFAELLKMEQRRIAMSKK